MALRLPRGIQFGFARLDDTKLFPATGLAASGENAAPAFAEGSPKPIADDIVLLTTTGWPAANNKVGRVDDTGAIVGIDVSAPELYPAAAAGAVAVQGVQEWTDFTQQGEPTTSGGEQQFWNGTLLEDPSGRQISLPTFKNAKNLSLPLYFDPKLPWYKKAKLADAIGKPVVLRAKMAEETLYWFGYLSFDGDPTITANTPMGNMMTFTMLQESTYVPNAA